VDVQLPVVALTGATASGKTSLAVRLALDLQSQGRPAEIVNADSMLVYRGMDIGTAKPSLSERCGVPHHLIDILDVRETASVAEFQRLARQAIADCRARGVIPILVGGSALYLRAILDVFEFPGTEPAVRARWQARLDAEGPEALHRLLAERSPAASRVLAGNGRRIVRALEVLELTGSFSATLPSWTYAVDGVRAFALALPRDGMDARIEARVHQMWREGLVAEVRGLLDNGLREGLTASRALGYRQVIELVDGRCTEQQAIDATINGTRRFARKQLGWFRRDPRLVWLPASDDRNVERIVQDTLGT